MQYNGTTEVISMAVNGHPEALAPV